MVKVIDVEQIEETILLVQPERPQVTVAKANGSIFILQSDGVEIEIGQEYTRDFLTALARLFPQEYSYIAQRPKD